MTDYRIIKQLDLDPPTRNTRYAPFFVERRFNTKGLFGLVDSEWRIYDNYVSYDEAKATVEALQQIDMEIAQDRQMLSLTGLTEVCIFSTGKED